MTGAEYYQLSATERDALLATALAASASDGGPHKSDVHDRAETLRGGDITKPTTYTALDRLADAGVVRVTPSETDNRAKRVTLTPYGIALLDAAGERLTDAAYTQLPQA